MTAAALTLALGVSHSGHTNYRADVRAVKSV